MQMTCDYMLRIEAPRPSAEKHQGSRIGLDACFQLSFKHVFVVRSSILESIKDDVTEMTGLVRKTSLELTEELEEPWWIAASLSVTDTERSVQLLPFRL